MRELKMPTVSSASEYNREIANIYHRARHLISGQIDSAIDHAFNKDKQSADEIRMQLRIRGWSEETRNFILTALDFYNLVCIRSAIKRPVYCLEDIPNDVLLEEVKRRMRANEC